MTKAEPDFSKLGAKAKKSAPPPNEPKTREGPKPPGGGNCFGRMFVSSERPETSSFLDDSAVATERSQFTPSSCPESGAFLAMGKRFAIVVRDTPVSVRSLDQALGFLLRR